MLDKVWTLSLGIVCCMLLGGPAAAAQGTVSQASVVAELQRLGGAARTIFVGQIVSIERLGGVVAVTFRVEQPVAGGGGQTFTMREWAGLWPPEMQRYTVGQRVLAFVHGASGAGLSSPVHGSEGLVPVVVQGSRAPRLLDVRRVAAAVVRAPGTRLPDQSDGAVRLDDALAWVSPNRQAARLPERLPLPVRGRLPVEFPGAVRGTRLGSAGDAPADLHGAAGGQRLTAVLP